MIIKPLIDAYETCTLTDPNDDFYLNRSLSPEHANKTLTSLLETIRTSLIVQFPEFSTEDVASIILSWEFSVCADWKSMRSLIQDKLGEVK